MVLTKENFDFIYAPDDITGTDIFGRDKWAAIKNKIVEKTNMVANGYYTPVNYNRLSPVVPRVAGYNKAAAAKIMGQQNAEQLGAELLGLDWGDLFSPARKITSGLIDVGIKSDLPVVSDVSSLIRKGNQGFESLMNRAFGVDISAGKKYTTTTTSSGSNMLTWVLIGGAVVAVVYFATKKKK